MVKYYFRESSDPTLELSDWPIAINISKVHDLEPNIFSTSKTERFL